MSEGDIPRPLVGYVIVEVDYHEDRDEPIHSFVSSPSPTREKAERELERKKEAYEKFCEKEGELYDEKDFSVTELKIHGLDQVQMMGEDRYETMMDAVSAVGTALLESDSA